MRPFARASDYSASVEMARELTTESVGRVVVRGANWVGDAVMTVAALREPTVTVLVVHRTEATPAPQPVHAVRDTAVTR